MNLERRKCGQGFEGLHRLFSVCCFFRELKTWDPWEMPQQVVWAHFSRPLPSAQQN